MSKHKHNQYCRCNCSPSHCSIQNLNVFVVTIKHSACCEQTQSKFWWCNHSRAMPLLYLNASSKVADSILLMIVVSFCLILQIYEYLLSSGLVCILHEQREHGMACCCSWIAFSEWAAWCSFSVCGSPLSSMGSCYSIFWVSWGDIKQTWCII